MDIVILENLVSRDGSFNSHKSFDDNIRYKIRCANLNQELVKNHMKKYNIDIEQCGESIRWEYVCKIFYCLLSHAESLNEIKSVKVENVIKSALEFVTSLGLIPSLLPGIGISLFKRCKHVHLFDLEEIGIVKKYFRLRACTDVLIRLWEIECTKKVLFSNFLCDFLSALIQLSYAPLKKPTSDESEMTPELWDQLQVDRLRFKRSYDYIVRTTHQPTIIKELMLIQSSENPQPPVFVKKVLRKELSNRLMAEHGIINFSRCLTDSSCFDSGTQWQQIDIIARLVSFNHIDGFIDNICDQIVEMINSTDFSYEVVCAACINSLRESHKNNVKVDSLYDHLFGSLNITALKKGYESPGVLLLSTFEIIHRIKVIHHCLFLPTTSPDWNILKPVIYSLFQIFCRLKSANILKPLVGDLISNFLSVSHSCKEDFDLIFMGLTDSNTKLEIFCDFEAHGDGVQIKGNIEVYNHCLELALNGLLSLLEITKIKSLPISFFTYALETLCYFEDRNITRNKDLLEFESHPIDLLELHSNCHVALLNLLQELSCSNIILQSIKDDPTCIISFLNTFIDNIVDAKVGIPQKYEECLTIVLVLLTSILPELNDGIKMKPLWEPLTKLITDIEKITKSSEIKLLVEECKTFLPGSQFTKKSARTKLEAALSLLNDPLLPVRAHGLMEIAKLVNERDPETVSKKHFVLLLYQENLKNEDSYMYLTAINGLASLANICTEDALEILTKEYLDSENRTLATSDDIKAFCEIRMKIGEVLVKVTKSLGNMAPQYKTLLLNTFLTSCKDSDFLIRASALSNLAELCHILSYKMGTVVFEILHCIWSTIETDKSPECRRAAVMAIASILKGLGREALIFLKEALLPIYRTLKRLYEDSREDEVVRLHAQIALEKLNACVKDALFPEIKLEKTISVLDNH